jgi:hypothetical protein
MDPSATSKSIVGMNSKIVLTIVGIYIAITVLKASTALAPHPSLYCHQLTKSIQMMNSTHLELLYELEIGCNSSFAKAYFWYPLQAWVNAAFTASTPSQFKVWLFGWLCFFRRFLWGTATAIEVSNARGSTVLEKCMTRAPTLQDLGLTLLESV